MFSARRPASVSMMPWAHCRAVSRKASVVDLAGWGDSTTFSNCVNGCVDDGNAALCGVRHVHGIGAGAVVGDHFQVWRTIHHPGGQRIANEHGIGLADFIGQRVQFRRAGATNLKTGLFEHVGADGMDRLSNQTKRHSNIPVDQVPIRGARTVCAGRRWPTAR